MNAPNLAALLSKPADEIKRPVSLPDGTYFGIVKNQRYDQIGKNKTDACIYQVGLTHAHEDVDMSEYEAAEGQPISEREMNATVWLSEKSLFNAKQFVESCGIETTGRGLGELLPQVVGQPVILDIIQKPTQDGQGTFNEIKRIRGAAAEG